MRSIICFLYILVPVLMFGQSRMDNYWLWGYQNNMGSPYFGGTDIIVQPDSPISYIAHSRILNIREAFACIANERGKLLFYTNGYQVANGSHDTLENSRLYHDPLITVEDEFGHNVFQSLVMFPYIGDTNKVYLFHITAHDDNGLAIVGWNIYCTILDKSLNNGNGGIVSKNVLILEDKLAKTGLTAVQHANGRDWWLVMPSEFADEYYTVLVAKDTIYAPHLQKITEFQHVIAVSGYSTFSREGNKYARYEKYNTQKMYLMDFDRCTGTFYNAESFAVNNTGGGLAFSPNGKLLYCSENGIDLYQYRLDTTNIAASKRMIATDNGSGGLFSGFRFGNLMCDDKIYYTSNTRYLSVIHHPDKRGDSCMVIQNEITLPTVNGHTVPNYPNFYLGPLVGSGCDTIASVGISPPAPFGSAQGAGAGAVYPNPANEAVNIEIQSNNCNRVGFMLLDLQGKQVLHQTLPKKKTTIAVGNLAEGMYFYQIETDDRYYYGKLWIVR